MRDRLTALRRIEAVQAEMVKLAEWRLVEAERRLGALRADQERLRDYVGGGALGAPLAQAALRSIQALDRRIAESERERAQETQKRDTLRRRDKALGAMVDGAARAARRQAEASELATTMDAWLARQGGG